MRSLGVGWMPALALLAVLLASTVVRADGGPTYQCECCKTHFGKDPNGPTYWNRGLGYGRLVTDKKYEETLSRFNDSLRKGIPYTLEDIAWISEALFSIGSIKSGIHDPNRKYTYYLAEEPKDKVAHDIWWMQEKYGGKIWDPPLIEQYGEATLCTINEVRKAYPKHSTAYNRHVAILISLGKFDEVLKMVRELTPESLAIVDPLSEYLPKTMSHYVGARRYEEGVAYLATVKKVHGLSKETQRFWTERLLRAVDGAQLTPEQKKRIATKIRAI